MSRTSSRRIPPQAMAWYPVSTQVNNVHHDNASLIERAAPPPADEPVADEPAAAAGPGGTVLTAATSGS